MSAFSKSVTEANAEAEKAKRRGAAARKKAAKPPTASKQKG